MEALLLLLVVSSVFRFINGSKLIVEPMVVHCSQLMTQEVEVRDGQAKGFSDLY